MERTSLRRFMLRALCLVLVLPAAVVLYVFRENLEGKALMLGLVACVSVLGAVLLWGVVRDIGSLHKGLKDAASGDVKPVAAGTGSVELREMTEIIVALNRLTVEFRENAAQLENFIQRFATLTEITEITARVPDIRELFELVLSKAMGSTHARRGSIVMRGDGDEEFVLVATQGWGPQNCAPPQHESVARAVIEQGQPLLVEDVGNVLGRPNDGERYRETSFLVMPLKTKSGTIGAVCLSEKSTGVSFNMQDQQFLAVLLGQVGYAVENARLLGQALDAAQSLQSTVHSQEEQIRVARRQIAEAEKLSALGQLAGGVAHDFNNILQAILGYVEFGKRGLHSGESRLRDLDNITEAAERAAELTGQLLAFGGRQMLRPIDIDVNRVILDLMKMLERVIGENIERELRLAPEIQTVNVDPSQLERVLMNLCLNARDAIQGGGKITIATENVTLDERFCHEKPWARPGKYVRLSVTDTGCGMDEETRRQIFEPFFTTKEEGEGTGLGLASVYGIVRQHGGLIDVVSSPGQGAVFRIYLAVVDRPVAQRGTEVKSAPCGGRETILVAEDDAHVREVVCRTLETAGYSVLAAPDGEAAMKLFDENRPQVQIAVLDAVMPRMGGLEVARRVRAIDAGFPVVVCTGYNSEIVEFTLAGVADVRFLQKPVRGDALLREIREALDARQTRTAEPTPSALAR